MKNNNNKLEIDRGKFYYGLFLNMREEDSLINYLEEQDIEIENLYLSDLHVTLASASNDEAMDYFDKMIEKDKLTLGENLKIHVEAYGEHRWENGTLINQVLKVRLENTELEKFCDHGIAYITLSSNSEDYDEVHLSEDIDIEKCNFTKELDFNIEGKLGALNTRKRVSYKKIPEMYKLGEFKGHDIFIERDTLDNPENSYFGSYLSENPETLDLVQKIFEGTKNNPFIEYDGGNYINYFDTGVVVGEEKIVEIEEENEIIRVGLTDGYTTPCYTLKEGKETSCLTIKIGTDPQDSRLVLEYALPGKINKEQNEENCYKRMDVTKEGLVPNFDPVSTSRMLNYLSKRGQTTEAEEKFLSDYKKINDVMEKVEKDYEDFYKGNENNPCETLKKYLFYCLVKEPDKFEQTIEEVKESDFPFKTLEDHYLDFKEPLEEENRDDRYKRV